MTTGRDKRTTAIHVVVARSDDEALCGFPRSRMAWQPMTVYGFAATCSPCNELRSAIKKAAKER